MFAQVRAFGHRVNFKHFSNPEGFFSSAIRVLFQDSKGRIWIGCQDGLYVYNGISFYNFTTKDKFDTHDIGSICEDNEGGIWVGTNRGLFLYKHKTFIKCDTAGYRMPKRMVWDMCKDPDGTIWAASHFCVFHFDPKSTGPCIKRYQLEKDANLNDCRMITRKKNGDLIVGTENGMYIYKKDTFVRLGPHGGAVYSLMEFENNRDFVCGWGSPIVQMRKYQPDSLIQVGAGVIEMTRDNQGNIWFTTFDKGIFKYNGKDVTQYSSSEGLDYNSFWSCLTDREGNVWFGSFGNGLYKYSGDRFTSINEKTGLFNSVVINMVQDTGNIVWILADNAISKYNKKQNTITNYTVLDGAPLQSLTNFMLTKNHELMVGYYHSEDGYKIVNGKLSRGRNFATFAGVEEDTVTYLFSDHSIYLMDRKGKKYQFKDKDKFRGGENWIVRTKGGKHWIMSMFSGIFYYNGVHVYFFNKKNGFCNAGSTSIVDGDFANEVWIGTNTAGIYRCKQVNDSTLVKLDSITTANGLRANNITSLMMYRGKMFVGTAYGLAVMDMKEYYSGKKRMKILAEEEGFINTRCYICFMDEDHKIWLATPNGAYTFDTRSLFTNLNEPITSITNIQLHYEDVDWEQMGFKLDNNDLPISMSLHYFQNHLTFQYIGISQSAPTRVKYQTMLAGLEKNWSPVNSKQEITYSNISPGTYTFMVRACNSDGIWNEKPVAYVFTITPPFWNTTWFMCIMAVFGLFGAYNFVRLREKKLRQEKLILEEKVNERTGELKIALEELAEKQKEIIDSINYAKRLQNAILAGEKTLRSTFKESFILFKPKDIVSGDFYWMVHLEDKSVDKNIFVFAAADCTGHGVPGAFMTMLNSTLLNQTVYNPNIMTPADVLNFMNQELPKNLRPSTEGDKISDGMDVAFGIVDLNRNKLKFCGANNPCWIIRDGQLIELDPIKQAITASNEYEKKTFVDQEMDLKNGDSIYVFTDGYCDQFGGPKGKKFKYKTLANLLLSINNENFKEQKNILNKTFEDWKGNLEQVDDVCIIGIKI